MKDDYPLWMHLLAGGIVILLGFTPLIIPAFVILVIYAFAKP